MPSSEEPLEGAHPWTPREGELSNADLRPSDIPGPQATYPEIARFAVTYYGYEAFPDGRCCDIANARQHRSLDEMRACLFFEQRRYRHFGEEPRPVDKIYLRDLVEKIRAVVQGSSSSA